MPTPFQFTVTFGQTLRRNESQPKRKLPTNAPADRSSGRKRLMRMMPRNTQRVIFRTENFTAHARSQRLAEFLLFSSSGCLHWPEGQIVPRRNEQAHTQPTWCRQLASLRQCRGSASPDDRGFAIFSQESPGQSRVVEIARRVHVRRHSGRCAALPCFDGASARSPGH